MTKEEAEETSKERDQYMQKFRDKKHQGVYRWSVKQVVTRLDPSEKQEMDHGGSTLR